jgi:hypothetical protein
MQTFRAYIEWLGEIKTLDSFSQWLQTNGADLNPEQRTVYEEFLNMMENSPIWLQAEPSTIRDILVNNGFQEVDGLRHKNRDPRDKWEPKTETTIFEPISKENGYSAIHHTNSVDSDPLKAELYGKRKVDVPKNIDICAPRDLFEWLNYYPPREGHTLQEQIDLRFNNQLVTQGTSFSRKYGAVDTSLQERLREKYLGQRRGMLDILGKIVESEIPAVWFGRGLGNNFCLVNP